MANTITLSSTAIKDLINRYEAELAKLDFQIEKTRQTISELRDGLSDAKKQEQNMRRARLNGDSDQSSETTTAKEETASSAQEEAATEEDTPKRGRKPRPRLQARPPKPGDAKKSSPGRGRKKKDDTDQDETTGEATAPSTKSVGRPRKKKSATSKASKSTASQSETTGEEAAPEKPTRRRGRPKGSTNKATTSRRTTAAKSKSKAKAKPKSKDTDTKGYRLSETDELIMQALDENGKALITSELQDYIENNYRNQNQPVDSDDIRLKISRSLQKLVNRREDLQRTPFPGRGYAYARSEWFGNEGDLKSKYKR